MTITQIEAGPETDRRVAEALGWPRLPQGTSVCDFRQFPCYHVGGHGIVVWMDREDGEHFDPSTDWNDAMLAAERAGVEAAIVKEGPLGVCWTILSLKEKT